MAGIKQIGGGGKPTFPRTNKPRKRRTQTKVAINQDEWLSKALNDRLQKIPRAGRGGKFYPSIVSSPCDRYVYLAFNGLMPPSPIAANVRRIFDCGDYLGYRFTKYFQEMGILIAEEQPTKLEDPPISGRYDFLIQHEVFGQTIVELKSINDKGFKALITDPKTDHYLQLQIYLNILNIEHGIVLYENKNDQQVKCFEVNKNAEVWEQLISKCYKIMNLKEVPSVCTGEKYCRCKEVPNGKAMDSIISSKES